MDYISALPNRQVFNAIPQGTTQTITVPENNTQHQLTLNKDGANSGTIAVTFKALGSTTAETLKDIYGAAVVFNCASSTLQTVRFDGAISEIILTPTALNGTYQCDYAGW